MGKKILLFLGGAAAGVAGTLGVGAIVKHVKSKKEKKYTEVPPKKSKNDEAKKPEKKPDEEKK